MGSIDTVLLVAVVAWLLGFGAAAAWLAVRHRRNPLLWAGFGAILGPGALAILAVAPPGHCWSCSASTAGWSTVCAWCGEDVREPTDQPTTMFPPGPLTVIQGTAPEGPLARPIEIVGPSPRGSVDPSGPVQRLRSTLGGAGVAAATARSEPAQSPATAAEPHDFVMASAVYVTGSRALQAGSRYGIALVGSNLGILGPVDVDPAAIAILRPLRGIDATGVQGQLIITADERSRDRFALVFMALAGGSPERVAQLIAAAAAEVNGRQ